VLGFTQLISRRQNEKDAAAYGAVGCGRGSHLALIYNTRRVQLSSVQFSSGEGSGSHSHTHTRRHPRRILCNALLLHRIKFYLPQTQAQTQAHQHTHTLSQLDFDKINAAGDICERCTAAIKFQYVGALWRWSCGTANHKSAKQDRI